VKQKETVAALYLLIEIDICLIWRAIKKAIDAITNRMLYQLS